MALLIKIAPASVWQGRLELAGKPTTLAAISQDQMETRTRSILDRIAACREDRTHPLAAAAVDQQYTGWSRTESLLWNDLLPIQLSSGEFHPIAEHPGHEKCATALESILANSIQDTADGIMINLPIPASGTLSRPGGELSWQLRSSYPERGWMSFTVFPSQPMDLTIRIRSDASITHGVQLVCNGSLQDPALEQGYLRVSNVWRPGDTIELRYGIPFAVHASSARPLRRSYPGASTSCQAVVFHGARALGLADRSSPGIPSADQRCISIGVRKDGVLLLRPQSLGDISPFQRPGDLFMGMSEHDQPLASVSLEGSLVLMTPLIHSYDVNYVSFETVFDRGTA